MERLRTSSMGLSGVGANYLHAIRSDDRFDLVAIADTDPNVLRRDEVTAPVRAFDDYRSLVVETAHAGLDVLFVAVEPHTSREFVEMAAVRGIAVFQKSPPARTVHELESLANHFTDVGCHLVVARRWQAEPAFAPLARLDELTGPIHAATADVRTADPPTGWRGDSIRAGGGVLLNGAYDALDLLVHLLGLPETVYAQCTARDASPNYDTEDVAMLSLRFGGGQIACLTADRGFPEPDLRITLRGTRSAVTITDNGMSVHPRNGGPVESHPVGSTNPDQPAISAFGRALCSARAQALALDNPRGATRASCQGRGSEVPKVASTAAEHLNTLAVIEAAYLSSETCVPESPRQLLGREVV